MTWTFPTYPPSPTIDWEFIEQKFVWLHELKDVPQDPKWHTEGNVFIHTQMVVEALLSLQEFHTLTDHQKHIVYAAALLHDIEKRSTTKTVTIDGVSSIISPKHSKRGEYTVREMLYKEIETPFFTREHIAKLVRYHGLPLWVLENDNPSKEVIKASLVVNTEHLYLLAKADVLGRDCLDKEDVLVKIDLFKVLCEENDCFGKKKSFPSHLSRYVYLQKHDSPIEYEPFDDMEFTVYMMSGLPGAGKDTYITNNLRHVPMVSLDNIRREYAISPTEKKENGRVVQIGKEKAKEFLRKKQSFIFNATNLTRDRRNKWTSLFHAYHARIKIIYVEVPYNQLITQNQHRDDAVPNHVIDTLIRKWEIPGYEEAQKLEYFTQDYDL